MKTIRASEIGAFLFCRRAWWYRNEGLPSENQAELAGGSAFHQRHGRQVMRSDLLRLAGWVLFGIAVLLLAVALTIQFVG
jgi:CRISPR/Cas system-associated exonuclease Cas4 (RecB family)